MILKTAVLCFTLHLLEKVEGATAPPAPPPMSIVSSVRLFISKLEHKLTYV